jgi:hypothetical protein
MKKTKFSDERIAYILCQAEGGTAATKVCRPNRTMQPTAHSERKQRYSSSVSVAYAAGSLWGTSGIE